MINEQEAFQALQELLAALDRLGAADLAREIRFVVARGTVRIHRQERDEHRMQMAYSALDAYALAVRMVLAALDPALMMAEIPGALGSLAQTDAPAEWAPDVVEGAQFDLEQYQEVAPIGLPSPQVVELLERAKKVLEVHNSILAEHELLLTE